MIFFLFASFLLGGCSFFQMNSEFSSGESFYHDLVLEVNGKEDVGIITIPYKKEIKINAKVKHRFDYMSIRTLNREIFKEESTRKVEETLFLNHEIENGLVVIDIGLFNLEKTQHYWGKIFVLDEDPETRLEALSICNGKKTVSVGTTACQAREGYVQFISFKKDVTFIEEDSCKDTLIPIDSKNIEIKTKKGLCLYRFADDNGQQHRLVIYGYNKIFFRNLSE